MFMKANRGFDETSAGTSTGSGTANVLFVLDGSGSGSSSTSHYVGGFRVHFMMDGDSNAAASVPSALIGRIFAYSGDASGSAYTPNWPIRIRRALIATSGGNTITGDANMPVVFGLVGNGDGISNTQVLYNLLQILKKLSGDSSGAVAIVDGAMANILKRFIGTSDGIGNILRNLLIGIIKTQDFTQTQPTDIPNQDDLVALYTGPRTTTPTASGQVNRRLSTSTLTINPMKNVATGGARLYKPSGKTSGSPTRYRKDDD
jgi:hypothetical protein